MVDFFNSLISFLETAWNFIVSMIEGLVQALNYVVSSTVLVSAVTAFMPTFATGCVLAVFGIAVTKFIIGR